MEYGVMMIITIDGPAASGKSTISRNLAQELNYFYLCSGLLYRALAYILANHRNYSIDTLDNPSPEDIEYCLDPQRFSYRCDNAKNAFIFFDDHNITPYLKEKVMDKLTSIISSNTAVREEITKMQKYIVSDHNNIVVEGRDVGSHVFPNADFKFFITASVEIRAERWRKDQEKYGNHLSLEQAIEAISDRDEKDKNRLIAPLIIPENAIILDTSDLTLQQSVNTLLKHIKTNSGD